VRRVGIEPTTYGLPLTGHGSQFARIFRCLECSYVTVFGRVLNPTWTRFGLEHRNMLREISCTHPAPK